MSVRFAFALILAAAPAGAAPLCHDLRGLYTPCPPGQAKPKPRPHGEQHAEQQPSGSPAASAPATPPKAAAKARPSLITQGHKLCRDSKGLYTPCPR